MLRTIGVIGFGSIGKRHVTNLCNMGFLVRVHDPAIGYDSGSSEDSIMKSDAVVIASPTEFHSTHMLDCIKANKPFFIEKPVGGGLEPELYDKVTMVGYNLRFHSCVKKAKEWLDAGLIGKPLWANFTCAQFNEKPAYLRDGVILNWSHEIDLALYLLGNGSVAASSTRLSDGHDDLTDILLTHENGCRSTVHLDYLTKPEERNFTIAGTDGRLYANICRPRFASLRLKENSPDTFYGFDSFDENYVEEMEAFIQRLDGKTTLGATGAEGLKVLEICLEVRKKAGL